MLRPVADGVSVHESTFLKTNAIVVDGRDGVLLIDPGLQVHELACLADDLDGSGRAVAAGFATHPHWDHLLWHARFGEPPRYATARCAEVAAGQLADPGYKDAVIAHLDGTGIAEHMSLDLYGLVTGLPEGAGRLPWDGPEARVLEHRAHTPGHAALLIGGRRVLAAGDMLSDVLVPMLGFDGDADPVGDYLAALDLLEGVADEVDVVVPGHGTPGGDVRARIERDRAYVHALREGRTPDDPRLGAAPGWEFVDDIHGGQVRRLAAWREGRKADG